MMQIRFEEETLFFEPDNAAEIWRLEATGITGPGPFNPHDFANYFLGRRAKTLRAFTDPASAHDEASRELAAIAAAGTRYAIQQG